MFNKKDISKIIVSLSKDILIIKGNDISKDIYEIKHKWFLNKFIESIGKLSAVQIKWIADLSEKKKGKQLARDIYDIDMVVGTIIYNLYVVLNELENLKYRREKSIDYKSINYIDLLRN